MPITTIPSSGTTDGTNLVKISTTNITSDVSQVDFEPTNFTDYNMYSIIINRLQVGTDNVAIRQRIKAPSVYGTSEYGSQSGDGDTSSTDFNLLTWDNVGNNLNGSIIYEDYSAQIFYVGFEENRRFRYFGNVSYGNSASNKRGFDIAGGSNDTDEVTGIRIYPGSGVFKSGQLTLYGVRT